jgi:glycosyltransferase involved in cell wall biosynthesis
MPKALYVSYDGITDPLGQSQILPYLLELNKRGFQFTLLSCEKEEAYNKNKTIIENLLEGADIDWVPISYTKKPPILSTLYDYWRLKRKAISLHRSKNFQLIHCRSYIPSMIGLWMKKHFQVKFIFDMRGFWADERVDGGLWNTKNIIYKRVYSFFKRQEKEFLENADQIVSLTRAGKNVMDGWKQVDRHPLPISIIPCCADADLFDPQKVELEAVNKARDELGIKAHEPVITYLGSIGTWYLLDDMLAFFKIYLEKFPAAKFLFISQDNPDLIISRACAMGISAERVLVVAAKRSDVPILATLGEYSIFFIKPVFSKLSSSPTKQGELMALGIPVICNAGVGDTDRIVREYSSGIIIDSLNDKNYREIINNINNYSFDADKIRGGAIDYFSLKQGVASYEKIYRSLL